MDIIKTLPEFLDVGVEEEEYKAIASMALGSTLKELKLAVGKQLVQYRLLGLMGDNMEMQNKVLEGLKKLKKQYHMVYAEFKRLQDKDTSVELLSGDDFDVGDILRTD